MPASTRRPQVAVGSPCWIVVGRTEYPASVVASRGDGKVLVRWSTTFEDHAKWVSAQTVRGDRRRYGGSDDAALNLALAFSVSTAPHVGGASFPGPQSGGDSSSDESDDGTRPDEISDSECGGDPPPPSQPPKVCCRSLRA